MLHGAPTEIAQRIFKPPDLPQAKQRMLAVLRGFLGRITREAGWRDR